MLPFLFYFPSKLSISFSPKPLDPASLACFSPASWALFSTAFIWSWAAFTSAAFDPPRSAEANSLFKDATLGDLPYRVHITATNIVSGKLHIFGPEIKIVDAILASAAFPGIISPYEIDGKLYSDGGILNHFPTDVLQGRCEALIGVYLSPIQKIKANLSKNIKI